jgi:hypothetical protein
MFLTCQTIPNAELCNSCMQPPRELATSPAAKRGGSFITNFTNLFVQCILICCAVTVACCPVQSTGYLLVSHIRIYYIFSVFLLRLRYGGCQSSPIFASATAYFHWRFWLPQVLKANENHELHCSLLENHLCKLVYISGFLKSTTSVNRIHLH